MGAIKQMTIDFGKDFEADQPNIVSSTQELVSAWVYYANTNKLNPKTKKYRELQHAYLCGIKQVMGEQIPMPLFICLHSGRDIASLRERTQPR